MGKGCDDCFNEGTYAAYATEQMERLVIFLQRRGIITKRLGEWQ